MFVLVLAAEADETRQAITFLIVCLVGVAALLSALTVWYWRYTSPKRQAAVLHRSAPVESRPVALSAVPSDHPVALVPIEPADSSPDAAADTSTAADPTPTELGAVAAATTVEIGSPPAAPATVSASSADSSPAAATAPASSPSGDAPGEGRIEVPDRSAGREAMADRIEIADRHSSGSRTGRNGRHPASDGTSVTGPTSSASAATPSESPASPTSPNGDGGAMHGRRSSGQNGSSRPPATGAVNGCRYPHHDERDELSAARRRRDRKSETLSDEDWAAIMKSAFEQMFQ